MTTRDSVIPAVAAALLVVLGGAAPASAQPADDASVSALRDDYLCQLRVGGFISLTKPDNKPSQADLNLMDQVYQTADRIIYHGEVMAERVGPAAAKRVLDDLLPAWYAGLKHGDGQPDKAAILRADLSPGLRACVERARTLPRRPE